MAVVLTIKCPGNSPAEAFLECPVSPVSPGICPSHAQCSSCGSGGNDDGLQARGPFRPTEAIPLPCQAKHCDKEAQGPFVTSSCFFSSPGTGDLTCLSLHESSIAGTSGPTLHPNHNHDHESALVGSEQAAHLPVLFSKE